MTGVIIGIILAVCLLVFINKLQAPQRAAEAEAAKKIKCPHCDSVGTVTWQRIQRKQGISGGKATGALMTGGVSMFATGLSRKQTVRHMTCTSCRMEWDVA